MQRKIKILVSFVLGLSVGSTGADVGAAELSGPNVHLVAPGTGSGQPAELSSPTPGSGVATAIVRLGAPVANQELSGTGDFSTVSDSTSLENGILGQTGEFGTAFGTGIHCGAGSIISGNTASSNAAYGIAGFSGSTISNNTSFSNELSGITAWTGSTVSGNTVRANASFGLEMATGGAYSGNTISNNTGGTVSGGVDAGGNVCDGSTTCP